MNSDKIQQLTESIHRTVEALNECCRTSVNQTNTQGTCNTFGATNYGAYGSNPMSFGWSPSRVGPYPVFNNGCLPTNYTPWQGWTGNSFGHSNPTGFSYPTWGTTGSMQSSCYSPVQTFGGTPSFNGFYNPYYGTNQPTNFFNGFYGSTQPTNFFNGFYGSSVPSFTPGWGLQNQGYPMNCLPTSPMGTWGQTGTGSFPFYGTQGFGFPFFGYGQPGTVDNSCGPQNQQTGWTPNCGPTGVVDIPLAA